MNPRITSIILCAGASSRMGIPKALLEHKGKALLSHHIDAVIPFSNEIRVVTGSRAELLKPLLFPHTEIHNPQWQDSEMRHSIALGLAGLGPNTIILLTPVDCPPAKPGLIQRLLDGKLPACGGHNGIPGHPLLGTVKWLQSALDDGPLCHQQDSFTVHEGGVERTYNLNTPEDWAGWTGVPPRRWRRG